MYLKDPQLLKILVGFSLVSLLAFLAYWNIENYNRERHKLTSDLTNFMSLACSEYRDSVVQKIFTAIKIDSNLVLNSSGSTVISHDRSEDKRETFIINRKLTNNSIATNIKLHENHDTLISITLDSSDLGKADEGIFAWRESDTSSLRIEFSSDTMIERILIRKEDNSFTHDVRSERVNTRLPIVYSRIQTFYNRRLSESNLNLKHKIIRAEELVRDKGDIVIPFEYESFGLNEAPVAVFSDVNGTIWQRLTPSLIMSLILFSVVALSFYVILKSWLGQIRLTAIKNEFISNMTHELKTPISTVGVALEALDTYGGLDNPEKRKEYLEISKHELNRLNILVDKVLKMSTLDSNHNNVLTIENINITQLFDDMLKSMQLHFEKEKVNLSYLYDDAELVVQGDKIHLTNVFYNLIDNAIKYSKKPSILKVHLSNHDEHVGISIIDNGKGIPKQYVSKVFDRFFRVPSDNIHDVKGHGLGLHYVKSIIDKHKGSVSLESHPGIGTKIRIMLRKNIND